jgi:hypothetical protein
MQRKTPPSAEDAYADMSQSNPQNGKEAANRFVLLYGFDTLSAYLFEHEAVIAYPLLLAIHRHLRMAEKREEMEVALTAAVWKDAGVPPEARRTRNTILAHLRRMPDLVVFREDWTPYFRYRVRKGPAWRQMEQEAGKGKKK